MRPLTVVMIIFVSIVSGSFGYFVGRFRIYESGARVSTNTTNSSQNTNAIQTSEPVDSQREKSEAAVPRVETAASEPERLPPAKNESVDRPIEANFEVPVAKLISAPSEYDGRAVCTTGYYENSFEQNALAETYHVGVDGNKRLSEPRIWIETALDTSTLECSEGSYGTKSCQGLVTICGVFDYAPAGQTGFGNRSSYRYQIW